MACARFFYFSRRYEEALEHFAEPLRFGPNPLEVRLYLALIHTELGNHDAARSLAQQAQRSAGAHLPLRGWIAEIYTRCRECSLAEVMAEEFSLRSADAQLSGYRQARLALALDDRDAAISLLSASYVNQDAELPYLAVDPRFDSIRELPQFAELVRKIRSANSH